ncbi:armadillo repeat-containing protein 10-like [Asterias amurensis]|uniref:armadillo repeat-containing protein 10-like n=1 Tax=Asterias amurensis TaxID=7602 RepID=UPI003AB11B75
MAAPMSFFPRMIAGGTTFIVVVAGAFYIYYKTRYIFDDKTSDDEAGEKTVSKNEDLTDEPEHRKEDSRSDSSSIDPEAADSTTINLIKILQCEQDDSQLCKVLTTLANQAAFTQGQNAVRLAGGLPVIVKQLEREGESVKTSAASCVANLSLNNRNQPILLKSCSQTLLQLSSDQNHSDDLRLACIQALVNLSVSGQCRDCFGPLALHSLFKLLGDGSTPLGQQALRVLVNLSADGTVSPALLQYEVPESFQGLLQPHHTDESLLRTLSFLLNLKRESLTATGTTISGATPRDSFSNYFSQRADELTGVTKALMDHGNTDVRQQAGRLLVLLSAP